MSIDEMKVDVERLRSQATSQPDNEKGWLNTKLFLDQADQLDAIVIREEEILRGY